MARRIVRVFLTGAAMISALCAQSAPSLGTIFKQPPTVTGPAPHFKDGTPDLSGAWMGGGSNAGDISKGLKQGEAVSMQPWAEKVFKEHLAKDDPEANCLPFGIPRSAPYPWRLVQTPTHYFCFDNLGHPHTEKLHTIERYTRTDLGHTRMEVTIDDPGAYTKPFTTVGQARLTPGDELMEYICNENDPDQGHYVGPARLPTDGFVIPQPTAKPR